MFRTLSWQRLVSAVLYMLFIAMSLPLSVMVFPKTTFAQAIFAVERATTEQHGHEQTIFNAGDTIGYSAIVDNLGLPVNALVTWQVTNLAVPNNAAQFDREIFLNRKTVMLPTGVSTISSPSIVPSDAAGPYQNKVIIMVDGQTIEKQSQFSVASGQACLFNAPLSVIHAGNQKLVGHVGWAFKISTGDIWEFGATEGMLPSDNWIKTGTWSQMLARFRTLPQYTRFTCRPWPWIWSNPVAADHEAHHAQSRAYDLARDNCLTRSVAALRQYGMKALPDPANPPQTPNDYFERLPSLHKSEHNPPTRWLPIVPLRQ